MKKILFFLTLVLAFHYPVSAQKIGGKVKALGTSGIWRNATLLSIKNGQYFIHYDNYPDTYDKFVKENEIAFIDGDDRKPIIIRDTIYVSKGKDNAVILQNLKEDTIFQTLHDTVVIQKKKKDTVYIFRRDTIAIFKTKRDTIYNFKHDTVVIIRTVKDTILTTKVETVNVTPTPTPVKTYAFRLGDLVLAYNDGDWKPAVVVEIKGDESFKVKFDGSSDYYNKVMGIGSLKLRDPKIEKTPVFHLGDLVQVYQDTEWKPAIIVEIKDNDSYKVKYDGYSDYYNNVVGVGSIKKR